MGRSRPPFTALMDASRAPGCWPYVGTIHHSGYPEFSHKRAHRLAYERAYGPIPPGMTVDHICFNKACVNPDHLQLLTHSANAARQKKALSDRCRHGHLFDEANTHLRPPRGHRACRKCAVIRSRNYLMRKRAVLA